MFLGTVKDGKKGDHFLSVFYVLQLALNMSLEDSDPEGIKIVIPIHRCLVLRGRLTL